MCRKLIAESTSQAVRKIQTLAHDGAAGRSLRHVAIWSATWQERQRRRAATTSSWLPAWPAQQQKRLGVSNTEGPNGGLVAIPNMLAAAERKPPQVRRANSSASLVEDNKVCPGLLQHHSQLASKALSNIDLPHAWTLQESARVERKAKALKRNAQGSAASKHGFGLSRSRCSAQDVCGSARVKVPHSAKACEQRSKAVEL